VSFFIVWTCGSGENMSSLGLSVGKGHFHKLLMGVAIFEIQGSVTAVVVIWTLLNLSEGVCNFEENQPQSCP
jgi:hypothetical protein